MMNDNHDPRLPDKNIATTPAMVAINVMTCSFGFSLKTCTTDKNNMATAMSPNIFALIIPEGLVEPSKNWTITIIPIMIRPVFMDNNRFLIGRFTWYMASAIRGANKKCVFLPK